MDEKTKGGSSHRRKLYLHVGSGKTGTSYLQNFLFQNRKILKENGYFYPTNCMSKDNSHNKLFLSAMEGNGHFEVDYSLVKATLEELSRETYEQYDSLILSSECLPHIIKNLNKFDYFNRFFKKFDVFILCYLRDPADFLESRYKQFIKDDDIALTDDFETFFNQRHHECDFTWLNGVTSDFGEGTLTVLDYDKHKDDLANSLLSFIELDKAVLNENRAQVNSSFCMIQSELTRLQRKHQIHNDLFTEFYKVSMFKNLKYMSDEKRMFLKHEYPYELLFSAYSLKVTSKKNNVSL